MAFEIQSTTERIESIGGVVPIGEIARASGLREITGNRRSLGNAVVSMFGLLALGRSRFEKIEAYRWNWLFSYIGTEGYMLDCELRPGSQDCQKGIPAFLQRNLSTIRSLQPTHPVLFRLDGGHDALDTLKALLAAKDGNTFFIIKRNLRRESTEYWREIAQTLGEKRIDAAGTLVYTATLTRGHSHAEPGMPDLDIVFQVTERTIDKQGNPLLVAELEVETWWTNLYERPQAIIELDHAPGTSEQFHSELKYDIGVERLPLGK